MSDDARKIPGRGRRIARGLLLLAAGVVLVLEVGLRLTGYLPAGARRRLAEVPLTPETLRPVLPEFTYEIGHPYLTYCLKHGFSGVMGEHHAPLNVNEWGFRGPAMSLEKPEGVYRIACLGGSSTMGHTESGDEATWPARLQSWLNDPAAGSTKRVEVLNGGNSGYSTFESLVNLAFRVVDFQPDLVIVYHTINDMRCALYTRGGPIRMDNRHWRDLYPRLVEGPGEKLLERSLTYSVLRSLLTGYVDRFESLNSMGIVNYDAKARDMYAVERPDERGFESFRRNLTSIQAIAKAHGAQVLLVTQGCDERDIKAKSRDMQIAGMRRMSGILEEVAREQGLLFTDAKTEMEAKAAAEGWDKYFTGEVHLTDAGADLLARIVAREIIEAGLVAR